MTMPPAAQRVLTALQHREYSEIEKHWLEMVDAPPTDADFYKKVFGGLDRAASLDTVHSIAVMLLEQLQTKSDWKLMYRILLNIPLGVESSDALRKLAARTLRENFTGTHSLDEILSASKIDGDVAVPTAIKRFRSLLRMTPGQVFQHKTWGEGVIKNLDIAGQKVLLDFPKEKGKSMTFEGVKNFLTYLPASHFLAQRVKEPEKLWAMGEENPVALIRMALEISDRVIKQSALKSLLLDAVVPQANWNSWWTRARQGLRLDPMIDFDSKGGAHAEIKLRTTPKTFEEEIHDLFFAHDAELSDKISAVIKLRDSQKDPKPDPKLLGKMLKRLDEDYQVAALNKKLSTAESLQMALLARDLRALNFETKYESTAVPPPEQPLSELKTFEELNDIVHVGYAMEGLRHLIHRGGDTGVAQAAEMLPKVSVKLAQAIWRELDEEHHLDTAVKALEELLNNALANPDTAFWAIKAIVDGGWNHLEDYFPITWLVPHLLDEMNDWQDTMETPSSPKAEAAAAKQLLSKVKSLLQAKHFAAICAAAEGMSLDQAQRLRKNISSHKALNETLKSGANKQLLLTRKDLDTATGATAAASAEADFHYCTAKARAEKMREMTELNSVIIPANSKEIEEARQEGDLRENAGYHAAKDKQKMLMQQTLQLQEALSSSRIMTSQNIRTDVIGFGVKFSADNQKTGTQEEYTILGRWEADADKHILSYLAPMVQQFLGKKVGEEVLIKHPGGGETPYRVLSIENALASGEWDVADDL